MPLTCQTSRAATSLPRVAAAALLLCVTLATPARPDLSDDLKSKDVQVRLLAVSAVREQGGEEAEELLLSALKDRDWEVIEHAVAALGERGGAEESLRPLLQMALEGPNRRVRLAAARSLALVAPLPAGEELTKHASGERGVRACQALAVMARNGQGVAVREGIAKGLKAADPETVAAACAGLGAFPPEIRAARLEKMLGSTDIRVQAAALDAARLDPAWELMPVLVGRLSASGMNDVVERRLLAAIRAVLAMPGAAAGADTPAEVLLQSVGTVPDGHAAARTARAIGLVAAAPPTDGAEPILASDFALEALEPVLTHVAAGARAAAAAALGRIRSDAAIDRATEMATGDPSPRVRLHALRAAAAARGPLHHTCFEMLTKLAAEDADPMVREEAAVALGVKDVRGAVNALSRPLTQALEDRKFKNWEWAACAAVSLGKTQDPDAVAPLARLLAESKDWKLRGAAVVGLGHVQQTSAVPHLISALRDKVPAVVNTTYEFLRRLPPKEREIPPKVKDWEDWWAVNGEHYTFVDREELARKAKKYGYAPTNVGVYEGLDVVVLQSRGDHIEQLLERLQVGFRITRQGQVPDAALHPFAVFVSNCTGEIAEDDVEHLSWMVRVGGYMFGSCWALNHTVEKIYPGVVRKFPTLGQVLSEVYSEECPSDSPYLDDVFDGVTRPVYVLFGSHLIEVLDPERTEVLIDSPECAQNFGSGNLACWFTAGHGVILDSANHFDLQGLERPKGRVKSAEDRMAYAMDHMGLSYEEVRALAADRIWNSRNKSAKTARDLSAFRLISNFVRHKRRTDN